MNEEIAISIAKEDYDGDKYQYVESGEDGFVKHDITAYYTVVKQLSDNTFWRISYYCSYNYGFDQDSVMYSKVKAVEKVCTVWVSDE